MKKLSAEYLAGFFDGEGSIWIQGHHNSYGLRVSISQSDAQILHLIKDSFGGKVTTWDSKVNNKTVSKWTIESGKNSYTFLRYIYPFLVVKKIQAEFAFVFIELPWRQLSRGGWRTKKKPEELQVEEMLAYSIKIAKPRYWENYTDINNDNELVDFVFKSVIEKFPE